MQKKWKDLIARLPARRRERVQKGADRLVFESRFPAHRPPAHPGEVLLEEFLKPLDIGPTVFARRIRVPAGRIWCLIRQEDEVSGDLALRLAKVLGTSADFWLNLQQSWELWQAMRSPAAKSIARLRPIIKVPPG
jgi:antitoxin HigA-1